MNAVRRDAYKSYSATGKKYWYKAAAGETRLVLPRPIMQAFANKQITCIEYDGLLDDEEREILQVRNTSETT